MNKSLSLLIVGLASLGGFSCESNQTKEIAQTEEAIDKPRLLILPEGDAVELYGIAFDSTFGSPDYFFGDGVSTSLGTWTFVVGLEKNESLLSDYEERILSGRHFNSAPEYQESVFKEIVRNPVFKIPDTTNLLKVESNYDYKIVPQDSSSSGKLTKDNETYVSVNFYPVAFNEKETMQY